MSTLVVATVKSPSSAAPVFQNSSGTEKGQLCKTWVNFNGEGTIAIRDDLNVSSLTDNTTGDYTVNFTNGMSDTNYSVVVSCRREAGSAELSASLYTLATGSVRVLCLVEASGANHDSDTVCVAIFGAN
tara:strand:+ start:782 stop:1168 length:387 start_codon:yes stop_codon:yes gene_type:complete